jgi:hypothetical protein
MGRQSKCAGISVTSGIPLAAEIDQGPELPEHAPESKSRQADFQDILNQASEETARRAQARAAAPPVSLVTRARLVGCALAIAVPVLATFLAVNVFDVSVTDLITPAPAPAIALGQTQAALDAMVKEIEAYRKDYEELPEHLVEVAAPSKGNWTYSRNPSGQYQVVLEMYGQVVTFDSTQSKQVIDEPRP